MIKRIFFYSALSLSLLASSASAQELTPNEIQDLIAQAAKRAEAGVVDDAALQRAAGDLATILHDLAGDAYPTPSASALLKLARTEGVGNALLSPAISLLDSASLVAMPGVSGNILDMISAVDPQLGAGLQGHMAAIGMGSHLDRIDAESAKDMFATLGARLGFNSSAPIGMINLEEAAGVRSPISGFNSAEFMAKAAAGTEAPLARRSGDVTSEKQSVMDRLKSVDWADVADEAASKGGLGVLAGGSAAGWVGPFWRPIGAAVGGTLGALWGVGRELERQLGEKPEPKTTDETPSAPSIGPAPGADEDPNDSGANDDATDDDDTAGDDKDDDCTGENCGGGDAGNTGLTPNMSDEGGRSGGRGTRPVTPDHGDSDPRPGHEPSGSGAGGSGHPLVIDPSIVTDFGNPAYRDLPGSRPGAPLKIDEGIIDPPQADFEQ